MVLIVAAAMIVFQLFLIFSSISFMWLLLLLVPVVIFGFYLNYDVRTMVRTRLDRFLTLIGTQLAV